MDKEPDLKALAKTLDNAGLLDTPLSGMDKAGILKLCRSVLQAYIVPKPGSPAWACCPWGRVMRGGRSVECRADLRAAGVFDVASDIYGVPIQWCWYCCDKANPYAVEALAGQGNVPGIPQNAALAANPATEAGGGGEPLPGVRGASPSGSAPPDV